MTYPHTRRILATIVATSCLAVPVSASAADELASSDRTDAAQSASTASLASSDRTDAAQSASTASLASSDRTDAAQSPSTASTLAIAKPAFPPADFRGGDMPVDHPGASRAPASAPTTVEVVRPVRTIVRNVDAVLPLILSSTALLLVLIGLGITLVHVGRVPRISHSR